MALRYTTPADFRGRLEEGGGAQPSTDPALPTHWDDAAITRFLEDAESEVEARLRRRYAMPLAVPAPPMVVKIIVALAAYQAMLSLRKSKDFESELDPYFLRYQWADGMLTKLGKGEADLPPVDGEDDDGFASEVYSAYRGRMFTPATFGLGDPGVSRITGHYPYRR